MEHMTTTSAATMRSAASVRWPRKRTMPPSFRRCDRASSADRSGPSPAIATTHDRPPWCSRAAASSSVPTSFWPCSRPTRTISGTPSGTASSALMSLGSRHAAGIGPTGAMTVIRSAPFSPLKWRATSSEMAMVASTRAGSRHSRRRSRPARRPSTSSSTTLCTVSTSGGRWRTRLANQPTVSP